jgi:hypothetical protein
VFQLVFAQIGRGSDKSRLFVFGALKNGLVLHEPDKGVLDHVLGIGPVFHVHIANSVDSIRVALVHIQQLFIRTQ